MLRKGFLLLAAAALIVLLNVGIAFADDAFLTFHFNGTGTAYTQSGEHDDLEPFKGSANITVFNDSDEAWGGFHMQIYSVGYSVEFVDFVDGGVGGSLNPTSSQTMDSWAIDNTPVTGATMDLYFNSNPIQPGQSAWFKVYTDNTTTKKRFGLMAYPTPVVPEPSSLLALSGSLLGLAGFVVRKKR